MGKFCPKCGNPVGAQVKFCPHCGAPLTKPIKPMSQPTASPMPQRPTIQPMSEHDKQDKKKYIIVAAVVLAIILIGVGGYLYGSKSTQSAPVKQENVLKDKPVEETETQKSKSDDNGALNTGEVSYKQYVNSRFNYSLDYPDSFIKTQQPANNDGVQMRNPTDHSTLDVYGSYRSVSTLDGDYQNTLNRITGKLGYHTKGGNWYVVTWEKQGKLYYTKALYKNGKKAVFTLQFPAELKDEYSPILDHMEPTLKLN